MKKFKFTIIFSILFCVIKSDCPFRGQDKLIHGRELNNINNSKEHKYNTQTNLSKTIKLLN